MLIFAIVSTLNLIASVFSLSGIGNFIFNVLMVIGMWITFANAKKEKLSTSGLSLIRVPYTIKFVFHVIGFSFSVILYLVALNIFGLIGGIITFVFSCICYSSIKKTLVVATTINKDRTVIGKKVGIFAAVVMIINASFSLISSITSDIFSTLSSLLELIGEEETEEIKAVFDALHNISIVVSIVAFLASISGALVILQFAKRIKKAHEFIL